MTHHDTALEQTKQALANLAHGRIDDAQKALEKALQATYAMQIKGEK